MTAQLEQYQSNHSNHLDFDDLEHERQLQNELVGLSQNQSYPTRTQEESHQEPLTALTKPKVWQRGSTHLLFIAAGVGLVSLLLLSIYNSVVGRPNITTTAQDKKSKDNAFFHQSNDSELGKWKAAAAMGDQHSQLRELNNGLKSEKSSNTTNPQVSENPKSNPSASLNSSPNNSINNVERTRNIPTIRTATVRTSEPKPQVIYQPLPTPRTVPTDNYRPVVGISAPPINYRRTPSLPIVQKPNIIEKPVSQLPQPINYRRIPISITPPTPISSNPIPNNRNNIAFGTPKNEANDVTQQLELAANSGIYISNSGYNNSSPVGQDTPKTNPHLITSKPTPKTIITTHVKGIIASPVAWSNTAGDEKFRVQLLEPLLASDGSMILPKNTLLLAQIQKSNQNFVNAQIVSALLNGNETLIPPNSLLLQGKGGSILKASVHQSNPAGGFAKTVGVGVLNGVSQATKILNSPTLVVTGSSTTVSNENRNIGAAFTEGLTSSIVTRSTANIQKNLSSTGSNSTIFFLKQNTPVQIFVNQPFSI